MTTSSSLRLIFCCALIAIMSISTTYGQEEKRDQEKNVFSQPASYIKIMKMHNEFKKPHNYPLPANDSVVISREKVLSMKADTIIAIVGSRWGRLAIKVLPATGTVPTNLRRQRALLKKIKHDSHFPVDLDGFPLAIKMDKAAFTNIYSLTECKSFLIFPCIDTGWQRDGKPEQHDHTTHFTLSILGSEKTNNNVSHLHIGQPLSPGDDEKVKKLDALVDGAETWPYDSFTWVELQ